MLTVTRLGQFLRSTEEKLTTATESLPRGTQAAFFVFALVLLITQFWPR